MVNIEWKTTPIPEFGAVFPFEAIVSKEDIFDLLKENDLVSWDVKEDKDVLLIGHKYMNDHIGTYVFSTSKLFTDTRESFRNGSSMVMKDYNFTNKIRADEVIEMLESWKKDAETSKSKTIQLDAWGISMLIGKISDIREDL